MRIYKKKAAFNIYMFFALILLAVGIVTFAVTFFGEKEGHSYISFSVLPLLFVCVFFAVYEKNCSVLLTDNVIYIGHKVFSEDKKYNKASLTLKFSEIERVTVTYFRVQGKKPLDENKYTFVLKDGTQVKTYFYEYGKDSEKEIIGFLESKINR